MPRKPPDEMELLDLFADKSKKDGQYAIAFSVLYHAIYGGGNIAGAIQRLGNGNAATELGAIENLSMVLGKKLAGAAENLGEKLAEAAETIAHVMEKHEEGGE